MDCKGEAILHPHSVSCQFVAGQDTCSYTHYLCKCVSDGCEGDPQKWVYGPAEEQFVRVIDDDLLLIVAITHQLELMYAGEWQESTLPEEPAELPSAAPVVPFSLDYAARLRALAAVSASHM